MEVFIRNINNQVTDDDFKTFIARLLSVDSIFTFELRKTRKQGCATLTLPDITKAHQFLARYEKGHGTPEFCLRGKPVYCQISRNLPNPWLLGVLHKDEKDRLIRLRKKGKQQNGGLQNDSADLRFNTLSCGRWEVRKSKLVFVPFITHNALGSISANRRSLNLTVAADDNSGAKFDLVIDIHDLQSVALEPVAGETVVTITLQSLPKIYETPGEELKAGLDFDIDLRSLMKGLSLAPLDNKPAKYRAINLGGLPTEDVSSCLVYRIFAKNGSDVLQHLRTKGMGAVPLLQTKPTESVLPNLSFTGQRRQLDREMFYYNFPYRLHFQVQALWMNAFLSPNEVRVLLPQISTIRTQSGDDVAVEVVQRLFSQLPYAGPEADAAGVGLAKASALLGLNERSVVKDRDALASFREPRGNTVPIHKVTVTPMGLYLDGPDNEPSNRVLRRHAPHWENFLRVSFLDEDGERIRFDRESSNERIFQQRFKGILKSGIEIGGKHFDFLGFSHSSLRSQTCWFMAPFELNYEVLTAKIVIERLGDFSHIRSPAKCAARIGQAFSDSSSAVTIEQRHVTEIPDIEAGSYTFSDGVGTFSPAMWKKIREQTKSSKYRDPTLYQIRYQGAKGMISLDTRLKGHQLCLRPSMIKYRGSKSSDIEICGLAGRPLPMKLNRQHIKILEDLGVKASTFDDLQQTAIQKLRAGTASAENAILFLKDNLADGPTQLPKLLGKLAGLGIDATFDDFIRDVLSALIQVQLRDLKYRSRILVEGAVTLYGIMDETNCLLEGEIYCSFYRNNGDRVVLQCPVAVTRSPALHPGDVQPARAVSVPQTSPLAHLHNCVVFSQRGMRNLPSQLSGGDLDGDLYNIIYDSALLPTKYFSPAAYSRPVPQDIGRPVTANDMTDFFLDFMENDQLGRIATLHQVFADQEPDRSLSGKCLSLAALHSTAVDFSKTGVPVNLKEIPKSPPYRPDFMAPSTNTKIEKGHLARDLLDQNVEKDEMDGYRYYESPNVIGELYRAINEEAFFEDLEADTEGSIFSRQSEENVLQEIWTYVESEMALLEWRSYIAEAKEIKENYEYNVVDAMFQYSTHRAHHLTEKEVFIGSIIGRNGRATKRERESALVMKERFDREVRETINWMRADENALERSVACLHLGKDIKKESRGTFELELRSFGWIAAAVCLDEVEKYQIGSEWY